MISTDDPLCSTIAAPHLVMMSAEPLQDPYFQAYTGFCLMFWCSSKKKCHSQYQIDFEFRLVLA